VEPLLVLVRAVPAGEQGPPQAEAVTAIAKIGGDPGADALRGILGTGSTAGVPTSLAQSTALLEAWRLGTRAPVPSLLGFAGDGDVNVAVQAETTLGVLGGSAAVEALTARLATAVFALRRQALIALAQTDSAAGATAAAALTGDADWRWRSVAAEAFGAAHDRPRLEAQLADRDGRVVAQALQALARIVLEGDTTLGPRARELLAHA